MVVRRPACGLRSSRIVWRVQALTTVRITSRSITIRLRYRASSASSGDCLQSASVQSQNGSVIPVSPQRRRSVWGRSGCSRSVAGFEGGPTSEFDLSQPVHGPDPVGVRRARVPGTRIQQARPGRNGTPVQQPKAATARRLARSFAAFGTACGTPIRQQLPDLSSQFYHAPAGIDAAPVWRSHDNSWFSRSRAQRFTMTGPGRRRGRGMEVARRRSVILRHRPGGE